MTRALGGLLLSVVLFACTSNNQPFGPGTPGTGGGGPRGTGGNTAVASTPIFARSDCGSLSVSDLQPGTSQSAPAVFAAGQLVAGRVDPSSLTNQEHHWAVQLAPGFYHLVLDARTSDGARGNIGIKVTRQLANGDEDGLVSGNYIARNYRDEALFEVKASAVVHLKVGSNFGMEDYVMGVFANSAPVPSPLFAMCPTVTPVTLGQPVTFTLAEDGAANQDQWFVADLPLGTYQFLLDAAQADDISTNLAYDAVALDRFGQESQAKEIVSANEIGRQFSAQGRLVIGETGSYWVRLRNGFRALNMTMTVSAQSH